MGKTVKFLIFNLLIFNFSILSAIGYQTTAGYTTYDWQFSGPVYTWCRTDPIANGVHVYWMWSNFAPVTDRNQRYNFYNFNTHTLNWIDGINVFTQRSGYGNLDCDPQSVCAVISTHQGVVGALRPVVARIDSGICLGPIGFEWSPIAVTYNRAIHCAMIDATSTDSLWYSRIQPWSTWTTPIKICPPAPDPMYPCHNIAASKISNKVVILWTCPEIPGQEPAYYRLSNDGGLTWQPPTQLPFPPQGMSPTFNVSSLFAMFDNQDNLHIVASVADTIGSAFWASSAGIWHWCPVNNPQWSCIHYYQIDSLYPTEIGYNALVATRSSIVQASNTGYLYVTWEQFDSLNYEPTTALSRADIWLAESHDNGQTWQNQQRITTPNTTSKRFPCVGGVDHDTLSVVYLIDSIAGFGVQSQGRDTRNPVVLHRIKVPLSSGIEEHFKYDAIHFTLDTKPNPFTTQTAIRYLLHTKSYVSLEIYDITGREVKTLVSSKKSAGEYTATWNGKDKNDIEVAKGEIREPR